ncbi:MAG TPA: hypothetical protein PKI55_06275 [Chitinophagaceae bacterium]|nr:hypothetical protein [Chitinophagaceae bacterium]
MALSVLQLAPTSSDHVLYCSDQKKAILCGTQAEMFDWKHKMEEAQQQIENRLYLDRLREDRKELLINCGHSKESATDFLKQQMPYLFNS